MTTTKTVTTREPPAAPKLGVEPTTPTKFSGTDPQQALDKAFVKLDDLIEEVRLWLIGDRGLKLFWGNLESMRFPRWFEWEPSIRAAVEAGFRKRIGDPEFIKPIVCLTKMSDRGSAAPRIGRLVAISAGYHALATVGGRAAFVMWAEKNGAPRYASEELSNKSPSPDDYVGDGG